MKQMFRPLFQATLVLAVLTSGVPAFALSVQDASPQCGDDKKGDDKKTDEKKGDEKKPTKPSSI